jgi:carbamate kinase
MATTPTYINQRINNLQSQINSIISGGGGGVPTSSDLADVLVNGNSAGTTDIDMNFQDITNVNEVIVLSPTFFTTSVQPQQTILTNIVSGDTATLIPSQINFNGSVSNSVVSNGSVVINDTTYSAFITKKALRLLKKYNAHHFL